MVSLSYDPGCFPSLGCQRYGLPAGHLIGRLVIKGLVVPGLIVMPEVPVERLLQVSAILEGSEVDTLVFDAAPASPTVPCGMSPI